jgi:hypothetical protein
MSEISWLPEVTLPPSAIWALRGRLPSSRPPRQISTIAEWARK